MCVLYVCHPLSSWWRPALQVTYPLHIILRYEVERGLLDGSIKVDDVPQVWNAKMKQYLGVEPESDAQGCLQVRMFGGGAWMLTATNGGQEDHSIPFAAPRSCSATCEVKRDRCLKVWAT